MGSPVIVGATAPGPAVEVGTGGGGWSRALMERKVRSAQLGVQHVAQPVAEDVDGQHDDDQSRGSGRS